MEKIIYFTKVIQLINKDSEFESRLLNYMSPPGTRAYAIDSYTSAFPDEL